ncbi:hypothetical protein E3O53_07910 [Cryobacterium sp. TMT2-18-3]|uniref:hypothetical protein n=1 Tax=unclassified Cryobacterium TaxID=2649013 RepID=UPI00106939CD|nr:MULTISPECIES: hypothetical protein [unclassified Cryobacterium]TFC26428.1 hypothetical protein E3O22_12400 [Cryobacterium sp. TMT2-18-2]TFC64394.1 hypothetical protein E3O53_07910 [Cryobacterium sp. TMT2-18-3]
MKQKTRDIAVRVLLTRDVLEDIKNWDCPPAGPNGTVDVLGMAGPATLHALRNPGSHVPFQVRAFRGRGSAKTAEAVELLLVAAPFDYTGAMCITVMFGMDW